MTICTSECFLHGRVLLRELIHSKPCLTPDLCPSSHLRAPARMTVAQLPEDCELFCLFDCCHSGSILDLPFTVGILATCCCDLSWCALSSRPLASLACRGLNVFVSMSASLLQQIKVTPPLAKKMEEVGLHLTPLAQLRVLDQVHPPRPCHLLLLNPHCRCRVR